MASFVSKMKSNFLPLKCLSLTMDANEKTLQQKHLPMSVLCNAHAQTQGKWVAGQLEKINHMAQAQHGITCKGFANTYEWQNVQKITHRWWRDKVKWMMQRQQGLPGSDEAQSRAHWARETPFSWQTTITRTRLFTPASCIIRFLWDIKKFFRVIIIPELKLWIIECWLEDQAGMIHPLSHWDHARQILRFLQAKFSPT